MLRCSQRILQPYLIRQMRTSKQPLRHTQDMKQNQIGKRSKGGLNSEFSFSETGYLIKATEHNMPYYLPIARGRTDGFIPFPRGKQPRSGFELWSSILIPMKVNVTLNMPLSPDVSIYEGRR